MACLIKECKSEHKKAKECRSGWKWTEVCRCPLAGFVAADFKSDTHIKGVNVQYAPGPELYSVFQDMEFVQVASRAVQRAALKAEKEGAKTIDIEEAKKAASKKENTNGDSSTDGEHTSGGSTTGGSTTGGSTSGDQTSGGSTDSGDSNGDNVDF